MSTTLRGIASHLGRGSDNTVIARGNGAAHIVNQIASFRIDGKPVQFKSRTLVSISDGDEVIAAGPMKNGTLEALAVETIRRGWQGRTLAHHARAMALYPEPYFQKVTALLKRADLAVISDPHTGPLHARVKDLLAAGVTVALGQDDISDAYYPFGRNSLLEVAFLAAHLLWMAEKPLYPGRRYWLSLGTRTATAQVTEIRHRIDIDTGAGRAQLMISGEASTPRVAAAVGEVHREPADVDSRRPPQFDGLHRSGRCTAIGGPSRPRNHFSLACR